jgi:hypothetical protein
MMLKHKVSCQLHGSPESTSSDDNPHVQLSERIKNLHLWHQKIFQQMKKRLHCHQNNSTDSAVHAASTPIHHKSVLARARKLPGIK